MRNSVGMVLLLMMGLGTAYAESLVHTRGYLVEKRKVGRIYLGITEDNEWKEIPVSHFTRDQRDLAERCMSSQTERVIAVEYDGASRSPLVRSVECAVAPDFLYYWEEVTKLWHDAN